MCIRDSGKDRTTWFSPNKIWTNCGDKVLNVDIKAANVSESITPREYADLLFDGIGAALVFNFKRPVSYTHLDVYKRQVYPNLPIFLPPKATERKIILKKDSLTILGSVFTPPFTPVSYTHLDVYKRQVHCGESETSRKEL